MLSPSQFSSEREMAGDEGCSEIMRLSEGCISHVISLTSPADSFRSAAVSALFRSAAESDTVWECFFPADYEEILSRADDPVEFSSKKELYCRLSDSILIDGGRVSFSLERSSGRKCYTLCARELEIIWGDTRNYWKWTHIRDSRFPEVAELLAVCWLEIIGRMDCKILSPRTNYAAYLIYKLPPGSDGFGNESASVSVGSHSSTNVVCLTPGRRQSGGRRLRHRNTREEEGRNEVVRAPNARLDGWMEMELGEFFNGDLDNGNVEMRLFENGSWKNGLIVEGIEVRPK